MHYKTFVMKTRKNTNYVTDVYGQKKNKQEKQNRFTHMNWK